MIKRENKKAQTTLFIIIAIVIVVLAVLIYTFYPKIKSTLAGTSTNPYQYMQTCMGDDTTKSIELLSTQGGSINPEHYIVYNSDNIEYLCYTNENYKTCVMQQPMLKNHVEQEIKKNMQSKADSCFSALQKDYQNQGYQVNLKSGEMSVELLPKRVVISFNNSMVITKGETKTYDKFKIVLDNNLYELIGIVNSILNWEARYGDAETTLYMDYYHDLKVEKKKQIEGSKIYILTDRNTGNKFQFATRSVAWPAGY